MTTVTETSVHSEEEREEELEQEPGGGTSDLESRDEDDDDAKFSDAESIQLGTYDEEAVLTIRKGGVLYQTKSITPC